MGLLDDAKNLADKAVDAVGGDKVKEGIDVAADKVDDATGGSASAVVDQAKSAAEGVVDGLANN
jgi:hypothetical protein